MLQLNHFFSFVNELLISLFEIFLHLHCLFHFELNNSFSFDWLLNGRSYYNLNLGLDDWLQNVEGGDLIVDHFIERLVQFYAFHVRSRFNVHEIVNVLFVANATHLIAFQRFRLVNDGSKGRDVVLFKKLVALEDFVSFVNTLFVIVRVLEDRLSWRRL